MVLVVILFLRCVCMVWGVCHSIDCVMGIVSVCVVASRYPLREDVCRVEEAFAR